MAGSAERPTPPTEQDLLDQEFTADQINFYKTFQSTYPSIEFTKNTDELRHLQELKWRHEHRLSADDMAVEPTPENAEDILTVNSLITHTNPSISDEAIPLTEGAPQQVRTPEASPDEIKPTQFAEVMEGWAKSRADFEAMMLRDKERNTASFTDKRTGAKGKYSMQDLQTPDGTCYSIRLINGETDDGAIHIEQVSPMATPDMCKVSQLTVSMHGGILFNQFEQSQIGSLEERPLGGFRLDERSIVPVDLSLYTDALQLFNTTNQVYSGFLEARKMTE